MERITEFLQAFNYPLAYVGQDGVVQAANAAWCELVKRPAEQLGKISVTQIWSEIELEEVKQYAVSDRSSEIVLRDPEGATGLCRLVFVPGNFSGETGCLILTLPGVGAGSDQDELTRKSLEAIGRTTGKLGHDFNNILGAMKGCIDLMQHRMEKHFKDGSPVDRQIALMGACIRKGTRLTDKMRSYVRPGPIKRKPISLESCVNAVKTTLDDLELPALEVDVAVHEDVFTEGDESALVKMLTLLAVNSVDAMRSLSERQLILHVREETLSDDNEMDLPAGDYGHLAIIDHGRGLSSEQKERIFEPFFSTHPGEVGEGFGLSLPMAREHMRRLGGGLLVRSAEDTGTAVQLFFPKKVVEK